MYQYAPLIGRILLGLLFLITGIQKFMDLQGTLAYITGSSFPFPLLIAAIQVLCGFALIIGIAARYSAATLAILMIVTTAMYHSQIFGTDQGIFLTNLAVIGGLLYAVAYGSGKYAVHMK